MKKLFFILLFCLRICVFQAAEQKFFETTLEKLKIREKIFQSYADQLKKLEEELEKIKRKYVDLFLNDQFTDPKIELDLLAHFC